MAKSKSQRMKEYRAMKKEQLGDRWLAMENKRVKGYYVATELLTTEEKENRRMRNKTNARKFYYRHNHDNDDTAMDGEERPVDDQHQGHDEPGQSCSNDSTDDNGVSSTTLDNNLTVKMPFITQNGRKNGPKKRASRALKRSYKIIETLEDRNEEIQRKLKSAQKRIRRYEAAKLNKQPLTPKSKADNLIRQSGSTPEEVPAIRKQLIYNECLNAEIKDTMNANSKTMATVQKVVSGKVVKKYKMKSFMQKMTKLNRRKQYEDKVLKMRKKEILREKADKVKYDVQTFLRMDDNSRILPGKGDTVKTGASVKLQKRVLNDYMHNLHLKFISESQYRISLATFCRLRPKEACLVNFASRSVCLCSKHQNFSFKLRCLKNMNVCSCTSPDSFVDMYKNTPAHVDDLLEKLPDGNVIYKQWRRVKLPNGKERMRIVDVDVSREQFKLIMKKEFTEFADHVDRVTKQYKSVKSMKENLPKNHVLVQMDFSENYTCQCMEEIQSAYWNSSMVTLHPTIVYYNEESGKLGHKSMVFVSEVLHHNAAMVSVIVKKVVESVRKYVPDMKFVHFWTDSPSSQYRNKTIFEMLRNFENVHGCKASWHYFESGHGKSACDGVGGTTKRNADMAVKQNKVVIQDADDFYAWAATTPSEIKYQMVTPEEYEESSGIIEKRKLDIKPVKGTMVLHAVATNGDQMSVRKTTCVCENCFDEHGFKSDSSCIWDIKYGATTSQTTGTSQQPPTLHAGVFVLAKYDEKLYVGKILDIDNSEDDVKISFMEETKGKGDKKHFKWPARNDELWVTFDNIVISIEDPVAVGKSKRQFKLNSEYGYFDEM